MTKNYWKENAIKLIWVAIPLFISLLIWLVTMTYSTNTQVQVIKKDSENINKQIEIMNGQLSHKLDIELYNSKHNEVINDIKDMKIKLDKIYYRQGIHYTATQANYENDLTTNMNIEKSNNTLDKVDNNVNKVLNKVDFIYKELGLISKNDSSYLFTLK